MDALPTLLLFFITAVPPLVAAVLALPDGALLVQPPLPAGAAVANVMIDA